MEVPVNREIREYQEALFWGLTLRQLICGAGAIVVCIIVFVGLKPVVGQQTASWLCIAAAIPFGLGAFFRWHGMTVEQLILVWLKDQMIPRKLSFRSVNYNTVYFSNLISKCQKEVYEDAASDAAACSADS